MTYKPLTFVPFEPHLINYAMMSSTQVRVVCIVCVVYFVADLFFFCSDASSNGKERKVQRFNVQLNSLLNQLIVYHRNQTNKVKRETKPRS